jgi:hypothetical protein
MTKTVLLIEVNVSIDEKKVGLESIADGLMTAIIQEGLQYQTTKFGDIKLHDEDGKLILQRFSKD